MTAHASKKPDTYGIGAVARLTGLTDHTIRVWERRYGAVVAERAANGRRVYTLDDVEKLGLLKQLTDSGLSIGLIANSSIEDLRSRAQQINEIATAPLPDEIRVALLGEMLPSRMVAAEGSLAPVTIVTADDNLERFAADLERQTVDVVVLETAVLDEEVILQLRTLMEAGDAERGVLVYSFGRSVDSVKLRNSNIVLARAPVNEDEVQAAIVRAFTRPSTTPSRRRETAPANEDWNFDGPVPPRRFTQQQLAKLVMVSTSIDCECPHHLAQLVSGLSAFEIYSANCANRDEEDAALHAYLHKTTAQARALIEVALEKVARHKQRADARQRDETRRDAGDEQVQHLDHILLFSPEQPDGVQPLLPRLDAHSRSFSSFRTRSPSTSRRLKRATRRVQSRAFSATKLPA